MTGEIISTGPQASLPGLTSHYGGTDEGDDKRYSEPLKQYESLEGSATLNIRHGDLRNSTLLANLTSEQPALSITCNDFQPPRRSCEPRKEEHTYRMAHVEGSRTHCRPFRHQKVAEKPTEANRR